MGETTATKQGSDKNREVLAPVQAVLVYPWLGAPEVCFKDEHTVLVLGLAKGSVPSGNIESVKKIIAARLKFLDKNGIVNYLSRQGTFKLHESLPLDLFIRCTKLTLADKNVLFAPSRALKGRLEPAFVESMLGGMDLYEVVLGSKLSEWVQEAIQPFRHGVNRLCLFANWFPKGKEEESGPILHGQEQIRFEKFFRKGGAEGPVGKVYLDHMDSAILKARPFDNPKGLFPFDCFNRGSFALDRPVMPFHPVIFDKRAEKVPGVFFLSDIHVVARLEMLAKSDFRLIPPLSESDSPRIGGLINSHGQAFAHLLNQGGMDSEVDCLALGGDLVDFSRGFLGDPGAWIDDQNKMHDSYWRTDAALPWKTVQRLIAIDKTAESDKRYQRGTDAFACFCVILDSFLQHGKPIFILAGNHDAYDKPFGVYPMAIQEKARTNVNIPADANLTVMEARILHGETAAALLDTDNFKPYLRQGFQFLFNPFISLTTKVGGAQWIVMGWGDSENILGPHVGHTVGHLPVAEDDVTEEDMDVFRFGASYGNPSATIKRSVWFMSHYTIVSYVEEVLNHRQGKIPFDTWMPFSNAGGVEYNVGTFHEGKPEVWKTLAKKWIDVTISGHSHRFGVYRIVDKTNADGTYALDGNSVQVKGRMGKQNSREPLNVPKSEFPVIIVNDASGPLPRRNDHGEFDSYGRDNPAGTRVVLKNGVAEVAVIRAASKNALPRLAPEIDGWTLLGNDKSWVKELTGSFRNKSSTSKDPLFCVGISSYSPVFQFCPQKAVVVGINSQLKSGIFRMDFIGSNFTPLAAQKTIRFEGVLNDSTQFIQKRPANDWKKSIYFKGWMVVYPSAIDSGHVSRHSASGPIAFRVKIQLYQEYDINWVKIMVDPKWMEFPDIPNLVLERKYLQWT
jgi:hypothetical protein